MSFFYELIPTTIFRSGASTLTYSSDQPLLPGHIVRAPLGKTETTAIVYKKVPRPTFPCKNIARLLSSTPLPSHLLCSALWLSSYYLTPLPLTASLLLPVGVEKNRRTSSALTRHANLFPKNSVLGAECSEFPSDSAQSQERANRITDSEPRPIRGPNRTDFKSEVPGLSSGLGQKPNKGSVSTIPLNQHQQTALANLNSIKNTTKLLFGVTGSGKTNIYLKLTEQTLAAGKSVTLLAPEIALTSQLVEIFEHTFPGHTVLLHSKLTEAERHLLWQKILENTSSDANIAPPTPKKSQTATTQPLIIIGPRSALLAPLGNLGLIIIDEAHESSYFQENTPKYSALRLASFIARTLNIPCLLGSATPKIEDFYLARKKHSLVSLTEKAKTTAIPPDIKIINLTDKTAFSRNRYFSNLLLDTIKTNLKNHHQTLIYHNRRGSAPLTLCESCGWQALCPACFLPLTLHADSYSLLCHTCGYKETLPSSCPSCHSPSILHKGFGTKLLETELKKLFPDAKIARFDADNKKSESLDANFSDLKSGDLDIIIGTQTVSRGLDLPYLASIGVVQADAGLSLPDFSAEEKTFELLTQVIGRVGRGHLSTASVIIQTYQPTSPLISFATTADYLSFYNYLLKKRQKQLLPPFSYLARLTVTQKTEQTTLKKIRIVSASLKNFLAQTPFPNDTGPIPTSPTPLPTPSSAPSATATSSIPLSTSSIQISPPMPCFHERTSSGYSWQIIVKSKNRAHLLSLLSSLDPRLSVHISLDPPSLL